MAHKKNEIADFDNLNLFAYLKPYLELIIGLFSVIFELNEEDLNELMLEQN